MKLPRPLYLYWLRRIYRRSPAWQQTREYVFSKKSRVCHRRGCHVTSYLHVHHVNYDGIPRLIRWWHFLPFARHFIHGVDKISVMIPLCSHHHRQAHR